MFIYTKGYIVGGCLQCGSADFDNEVQFDQRELMEILEAAWEERHEYQYSNIYTGDGKLVGFFRYELSRHLVIGMKFIRSDSTYHVVDDGHGKKTWQEKNQ